MNKLINKTFKPFENKGVKDLVNVANRGDNVTHGDLLIVRCDKSDLPKDFNSLPDLELGVLAEGEHTMHAHQLFEDVPVVESAKPAFKLIEGGAMAGVKYTLKGEVGNEMFLVIENEPLLLKHQEHVPFRLYPGYYHIGIQQETDPFEKMRRQVVD